MRNLIGYESDEEENAFFCQTTKNNTLLNWINKEDADDVFDNCKNSKTSAAIFNEK